MAHRDCGLSTEIWAHLPVELIREILLHLASESAHMACTLRLVSRYSNVWVLPLLFRTLNFTSADHIIRFTSTLLPKRKLHIPALKSKLHTLPRALSSYHIESLALVVNLKLPSIETALASVAPAFSKLQNLAITGQALSSHAHWLRQHPIHPRHMMILHFGRPHLVNFREPVYARVTHLYTSVLLGHRDSSVADLPALTHLAVHTRMDVPRLAEIAGILQRLLATLPQLRSLVLTLNNGGLNDLQLQPWLQELRFCLMDKRFFLLPYFRIPRIEWHDVVRGKPNIWDRARAWRSMECEDEYTQVLYRVETMQDIQAEQRAFPGVKKYIETEWEVDLVQRANFTQVEDDPTERLYRRTTYPDFPAT